MKCLTLYYSRTGNTKLIAEKISKELSSEIKEIIDKKKRSGFIGYIKSAREAMKKNQTDIENISIDLSDFDTIIIGTPVWVGRMAPAVRTIIKQYNEKLVNIAFFCTSGGPNPRHTLSEMEELCGEKPISTLHLNKKEIKNNVMMEKIEKFVSEIKNY